MDLFRQWLEWRTGVAERQLSGEDLGAAELVVPLAGVSKPVSKALRSAITQRFDLPLTTIGRSEPRGGRLGGKIFHDILLAPKHQIERALDVASSIPQEVQKKVAGSLKLHEVTHGLVQKYFPFLSVGKSQGSVDSLYRGAADELLAGMTQALKVGQMRGTLGTLNKTLNRLEEIGALGRGEAWRLYQMAILNPMNALRTIVNRTYLSPAQKRAVLDNPVVNEIASRVGRSR